MALRLLFSDPQGRVHEHPTLLATVRSGEFVLPAPNEAIALPEFGKLVHLPGRVPVGVDPSTGELVPLRRVTVGRRSFEPNAVGALLPPGYTRTYLPGEVKAFGPLLPQWAYAGAGSSAAGPRVFGVHTDRRRHWTPSRYSTPDISRRVKAHKQLIPHNRVLEQLTTCALGYRCFTSQNIFYVRDEGAIPASTMCNAQCVGCISSQPDDGPPASHERMDDGPSAAEMAAVGAYHLQHATGRAMVSFGQGCEGEPLTRYRQIAEAIELMREQTARGSININTNASLTHGLRALFDAGLDAVRVSLNSANAELYEAYYVPNKYGFSDVEASIAVAREKGGYLALNLLSFPGVTDRKGEIDALVKLCRRYRVNQVQMRSLAIDPLQYLEVARDRGAGGQPQGMKALIARLQAVPGLVVGNFARGLGERRTTRGS